jgi:Fanconi-associated nuclease 1
MDYTQQLQDILKTVLQESFLFHETELQILVVYRSLPEEAQLLFFCLLSRTPDIREGQIEGYTDKIPAWKDALDLLVESKLVVAYNCDSVKDGLEMLKKDELVQMAKKRRLNYTSKTVNSFYGNAIKNTSLRNILLEYSRSQTEINFGGSTEPSKRMLGDINQIVGLIINIPVHIRNLFTKVSVIYSREREIPEKPFLNSILTNLTSDYKRSFPDYKIQRLEGLIWSTRDEFDSYFKALEWEVCCRKLEDEKEWSQLANFCDSKKDEWTDVLRNYTGHVTGIAWLKIYSSGHVLTRIMELGANAYFRLKEYQIQAEILQSLLSQNVFLIEHKGRWYDDLIKVADLYLSKSLAKQLSLDALCDENVIARKSNSELIVRQETLYCKSS